MVSDGGHDRPQNLQDFLLIKDDDKFFSRLLSKESTKGESSFRFYYYGGSSSSSIPFHWESQPGTPKIPFFPDNTLLPPLTPPPSYQYSINSQLKSLAKHSKPRFYQSIFSKRITSSQSVTSLSPSSSRSSSFSMSSMPLFVNNNTNPLNRSRSEVDDEFDQVVVSTSPMSTCFGSRIGNSKRFRVNYPMRKVKKILLSFVLRFRASKNIQ